MAPAKPWGDKLEIRCGTGFVEVGPWVFYSWSGDRRKRGKPYYGPVYYLGHAPVEKVPMQSHEEPRTVQRAR